MSNAFDRPRPERQPCPPHRVLPRNSKKTLRELITEDDAKTWRLKLLKEMSIRPTGSWREWHEFVQKNLSGDVDTFKAEGKSMIQKLMKALDAEWTQRNSGE